MTGSELRNYVVKQFKRTDKDTEIYEAITDVVMDMRKKFTWEDYKEEGYSTGISTEGEYKVALPSDFEHLIGDVTMIDDTGGSKVLTKVSKEKYDQLYPNREESDVDTGVPKYYCLYGGELFIGPPPDDTSYTYQINYTNEPETTIESSTANVPFTTRHRETVRSLVLQRLYDLIGLYDEAQYWGGKGEAGLALMAEVESRNTNAVEAVQYRGI